MNTGYGVIAFNSPEEAIAGIERIDQSYALQCEAARAVAEEYFDSAMVLTSMIERAEQAARRGAQMDDGKSG
jgi:hypothetical protein